MNLHSLCGGVCIGKSAVVCSCGNAEAGRGESRGVGRSWHDVGVFQVTQAQPPRVTQPIDWTSDDPHLSGNFAPIGPEIEQDDLTVLAGEIPQDLRGVYMRNGPNPLFKPISYTYPMDGDGMVHAVYFDNGRARYKNRFVQTRGLAVERRAGRAVYGGLLRPVAVDPAIVGAEGEPGPYKNGAFISVLHHGGHLLALGEAQHAYEMTMELETLGEWRAGTEAPIEFGAHNRRYPGTGELFALDYNPLEPVVLIHRIAPTGRLLQTFPVSLAAPSMIHDFVLTEGHIVLVVGPAVFDMQAAAEGQPFLQWRPQIGTRIGVISLDGSSAIWVEAEPFFVFHFANGFERGGNVVLDYVRHDRLGLGPTGADHGPPRLRRMVIDAGSRTVEDSLLTEFGVEFPRINDRFEALASRFVYVPTLSESLTMPKPATATFNTLVRVDTESGSKLRHDFGNRIAGEAVFIPRAAGSAEDDGYLAAFVYDPAEASSDLVLLRADRIDQDPVAVIRMPQRVPQGLHGTWIAQ